MSGRILLKGGFVESYAAIKECIKIRSEFEGFAIAKLFSLASRYSLQPICPRLRSRRRH